jgi:hypothetical protein
MDWMLPVLGLSYAALAVWLAVRIVNRRENWAKRIAAGLAVVLIGYPLSFGPACWWLSGLLEPGPSFAEVRRGPLAYWPLGYIAKYGPSVPSDAIGWYATLGLDADAAIYLPISANDGLFYDLGPCSGVILGKGLFH